MLIGVLFGVAGMGSAAAAVALPPILRLPRRRAFAPPWVLGFWFRAALGPTFGVSAQFRCMTKGLPSILILQKVSPARETRNGLSGASRFLVDAECIKRRARNKSGTGAIMGARQLRLFRRRGLLGDLDVHGAPQNGRPRQRVHPIRAT